MSWYVGKPETAEACDPARILAIGGLLVVILLTLVWTWRILIAEGRRLHAPIQNWGVPKFKDMSFMSP
jgi:hypothetical protein